MKSQKIFKKNPGILQKKSCMQASFNNNVSNIAREMLKIKETFLNLQDRKIKQVQKIISGVTKLKPCISMITKGSLRKQVIIPMNVEHTKYFIRESSSHITNINRALKNIKSNIMADFIQTDVKKVNISTNNVTSPSDLQKIKKYVKSTLCAVTDQINSLRLLQSKSYLKIVSIPYLSEVSNSCLLSNKVEKILKANHIFNDIVLVSKLRVIKVSPKSDMSIVWIDIWDMQNELKEKTIINRRFNGGSFITTICGANMNLRVYLCKNCWKWGHSSDVCKIQGSKCVKCYGSYQLIHHCKFA